MEYLSFDVGIKNLAYCCLDGENKSIKQWGIINLNENPICDMNLKKKCDKQASHVINLDGKMHYYCSTHIKHKSLTQIKCKKKKINTNYDLFQLSQTCLQELNTIKLDSNDYNICIHSPLIRSKDTLYNLIDKYEINNSDIIEDSLMLVDFLLKHI